MDACRCVGAGCLRKYSTPNCQENCPEIPDNFDSSYKYCISNKSLLSRLSNGTIFERNPVAFDELIFGFANRHLFNQTSFVNKDTDDTKTTN